MSQGFGTKAIHSAQTPNPLHGAVVPGIELATTYAQESPGNNKGFEYSRTNNPTRQILENLLASIECGKYGTCFSSGSSATMVVIQSFVTNGGHIICTNDVFGGTSRYFRKVCQLNNNIKLTFLDLTESNNRDCYMELEKCINENKNTSLLWIETPTNPMLKICNLNAISNVMNKYKNIITVIDNTFATPYIQNPLLYNGIDIVVHSVTKYINGHSDIVMGCVITNNKIYDNKIKFMQNTIGSIPSPFDCYMVIRGIKTLHLRMSKHCNNALKVAKFLENDNRINSVYYPFLKSHPQYKIAKQQMKLGGGMITFLLNGNLNDCKVFLSKLKLIKCCESLGNIETIIEHPAIMTHNSIPKNIRYSIGIFDNLIRLSVGIENVNDIINDLKYALSFISKSKL